jgi:RNA-directed DNA polymerase
MVFTTLAHLMDEDFLTEAFHQLRKDAAAGIDEMTVAEYKGNLRENITELHRRLVNREYRAHVGVLEEGQVVRSEDGTPQGAPVSPILANIFLHAVVDEWFQNEVRPRMKGNCFIVRYADDFVAGFTLRSDAERVFQVLPKRFERFGLGIHPEKSRLVQFSRPYWRKGKGTGSFAFLGFTHYWAKTLGNGWTIKRKTLGKRLRRFLSGIAEWCKANRHKPIREQFLILSAKLRGHYQYYGIRGNYKMMEVAYEHTQAVWKRWLARRNSKDRMSWADFEVKVLKFFELPKPRIIHAF